MNSFTVTPMFSSPLFTSVLSDNFDGVYQQMKDGERFPFRPPVEAGESVMSIDNYILNEFPEFARVLLGNFYEVKNRFLEYTDTDFAITTSWLTKTCCGEHSQFHVHKNSLFSGVLYFDTIPGGAQLEFASFNMPPRCIDVNRPARRNLYNSTVLTVDVGRNLLAFFPSHVHHRIQRHEAEEPRYSLAFNIMPDGLVSTSADSEYRFGHGSRDPSNGST